MNSTLKLILVLIAAALLYFFAVYHPSKSMINQAAPDFVLRESSGAVYRLSDYSGRFVLLHFWATWCTTCRLEMPHFAQFVDTLDKSRLTVLGISEDTHLEDLLEYEKSQPLSFDVVWDEKGNAADAYGSYALPESYLIGPDGKVLKKYVGAVDWMSERVMGEIQELIKTGVSHDGQKAH